jgi:plasmid stabilization system protein ParE
MNKYKVKIEPEALKDIQEITDWYNEAQTRYGKKFQTNAIKQIDSLSKNPQVYATRYKDIRCMLIKKFPYMVHFYINDETGIVEVLAVISTHRNPKIWEEKTGKSI